jgi:hypothetical protein
MPPVLVGALLQEIIVDLLMLASKRRLTPAHVTDVGGLLATLASEIMKPDGRIVPGELADRFAETTISYLAGKLSASAGIGPILMALERMA